MAIRLYLAMTAAEIRENTGLPPKIAWMACHFSPYCTGLSNLPRILAAGSVLMLDDVTPIFHHDPEQIAAQLRERTGALDCGGVLLDLQRPGYPETAELAKYLAEALPCPVAVSEPYARGLSCPVFLPPVPHHVSPEAYFAPWQGREIWLEAALDAEEITLTPQGAAFAPLPPGAAVPEGFAEERLHCHYAVAVEADAARFTLWRTAEDLNALLAEAERHGVTTAVGLYQELSGIYPPVPEKTDHLSENAGFSKVTMLS